ncbi:MAG: dihydropteroate synthase [Proteobacteria bacterium]|nr:dihydropteroate synthase [Pseudomonadota bacterium]
MLIVGERINSSRKSIAQAIEARDRGFITREARNQAEAGADYIDVNAGAFMTDEAEHLKWLIEVVQAATDKPLCVDSPNPAVIREVLPLVDRPPMINSITLEPERLEGILPLAIECKAKVIGLCQSESSMAETAEAKIEMAAGLVEKTEAAGLARDDLYIDPLVFPLGTNTDSALNTLKAIEGIMGGLAGVHTTCGLTNVSHGLPERKLINRTFLVAAVSKGLDSAILDPTDKQLYSALKAAVMVMGRDEYCMDFIKAFRAGRLA